MSQQEMDEDQLLADSSEEDSSGDDDVGQGPSSSSGSGGNRSKAASFFEDKDDGEEENEEEDSDEDEEEEMEVDDDALMAELSQVNDKLAAEPYSYDLHTQKIKILKGLGELDKLRAAREKMSELYPLSPQLWVEWLEDEIKMMGVATDEEKQYVFDLMEKAVKDYVSVEVWLQYVNLCLAHMDQENGVQRCRDVFERALSACGLNVTMGSVVWDTYRSFEAALLGSAKTDEEQEAQEKRYISLCKRQLAIPLLDMKNNYEQIKSAIDLDENAELAYKKALDRLDELESWEAKLIQATDGSQKVEVYQEYIAMEKKAKSNPARIQSLYERAVTDSPLSTNLWLEYIDYLCNSIKIPEVILSVCERATRNCSWITTVWAKYISVIETFVSSDTNSVSEMDAESNKNDPAFDKIKTVFESAIMQCPGAEQTGTLWLKYLEYLRRRIDINNPEVEKVDILRKTFQAAETHLLQIVPEPNDYISQILQFHARSEAHLAKGITEPVWQLWKSIFQRGYGQYYRVWIQYLSLEIRYRVDVKKIRAELGKAMSQVVDDPQSMADFWLNFERDFGDLKSLTNAETKISKKLEKSAYTVSSDQQVPQFQQFEATDKGRKRRRQLEENAREQIPPKKEKKSGNEGFKIPEPPGKKTKSPNKEQVSEQSNLPPGSVKHDPSKDYRTVFVSNLEFSVEENKLKEFFTECGTVEDVRLVRDYKSRSKGFGYVVFADSSSMQKALAMDRRPIEKRPVFVSRCDPDKSTRQTQFKYPVQLEKNKLFVKNLPPSLTQEDLTKMFEPFGAMRACRLITYRNGHSKGIAYVEFKDSNHASAALLKTDGTELDGQKISVAISNPPPKGAVKSLPFTSSAKPQEPGARRERNVFIPRSLQAKPIQTDTKAGGQGTKDSTGPKSNDDFRKMFMKK